MLHTGPINHVRIQRVPSCGADGERRRNSEGDCEWNELFTTSDTYHTPLGFLNETWRTRQRRKLAKKQGVSTDPINEQVFLTGYHGNWMTSWFRKHRRLHYLRSNIASSNEFSGSATSVDEIDGRTDQLFHRSTGEIQEGVQIDGFVLIDQFGIGGGDVPYNNPKFTEIEGTPSHWYAATVVWGPQLRFCDFSVGDSPVSFQSLFPTLERLTTLVMDSLTLPNFHDVMHQLALLALRCGPLRLVRTILELGLIDVRHKFPSGLTLLHIGCISQNFEVCLFLCTLGASRKAKDKKGRTPFEVCRSERIRKLLPRPKNDKRKSCDLSAGRESPELSRLSRIDEVLALTKDETQQDELQYILQTKDFCIRDLADKDGDYLIHILTRKGLPYLASIVNLIKLQGQDVNQPNAHGMTSLMIAASDGNDVLCDLLICVLGAYPNLRNRQNGYSALHYAATHGHLDVTCTLLKRTVDPNSETNEGVHAADLARIKEHVDCMNAIAAAQNNRRKKLTLMARLGYLGSRLLYNADLAAVDQFGDTLLMTAVRHDRVDNVNIILSRKYSGMNAQNAHSGKTALSLAGSLGHTETVEVLLSAGANPLIKDMSGCLALHQAIKSGHETTVEVILEQSNCWHELKKAVRLSPSTTITRSLEETINKRQDVLVSSALLEGAITGNVDLLFDTLEDGDDINPISGEGNWPALVAAGGGRLQVLQFLAENGGYVCGAHEVTKNTLLHAACENGHVDVTAFLLEHYAKSGTAAKKDMVNRYNAAHRVALQLAADNGYKRTVRLLLDNGASTALLTTTDELYTCESFQGIQLLIHKARTQHLNEIIAAIKDGVNPVSQLKELYDCGTDYNLRTIQGDSPLHVACQHGNADVVKFLLHSFTEREVLIHELRRTNVHDGATMMHRAMQGGDHVAVIRLLVAVDQTLINLHDQAGRTPLHIACRLSRRQTITKLTGLPSINVNIRDVNNQRPDDLTNNTAVKHMVEAARKRLLVSDDDGNPAQMSPDFDELNRRFHVMKERHVRQLNDNTTTTTSQ